MMIWLFCHLLQGANRNGMEIPAFYIVSKPLKDLNLTLRYTLLYPWRLFRTGIMGMHDVMNKKSAVDLHILVPVFSLFVEHKHDVVIAEQSEVI